MWLLFIRLPGKNGGKDMFYVDGADNGFSKNADISSYGHDQYKIYVTDIISP